MLLLLVVVLIGAALLYPYVSTFLRKRRMLRRLSATATACGFRARRLFKHLWSVRNRSARYDLLLENEHRIFAVKLWSAYRPHASLILTAEGRLYERQGVSVPLDVTRQNRSFRPKGRLMTAPRTHLSLPKNDRRELTRLLLVYPAYREILAQRGGKEVPLTEGDRFFDKLLCSPAGLERLLRSAGNQTDKTAEAQSVRS